MLCLQCKAELSVGYLNTHRHNQHVVVQGVRSGHTQAHTQTHTHAQPRKWWCGGVAGNNTWVVTTSVISQCRFRSLFYERTQDARDMDVSASSSRTAAKPSGGRKRKGKTPTGVCGINSTGKLAGRACCQVDWCCNCTRHSTCLTLGPSA